MAASKSNYKGIHKIVRREIALCPAILIRDPGLHGPDMKGKKRLVETQINDVVMTPIHALDTVVSMNYKQTLYPNHLSDTLYFNSVTTIENKTRLALKEERHK